MAINATKKFLDYAGLAKFWGIINATFSTKAETVTKVELNEAYNNKSVEQQILIKYADGTNTDTVTLPGASADQAGLMSVDHYNTINDLKYNIDQLAPFAGLEIAGNEVSLDGRRANIKLEYASTGTEKAVIRLVDADWNYTEGATWSEVSESDYTANKDAIAGRYTMVQDKINGSITYYKWSAEEAGPVNSVGAPLQAKPISEIDVTELVKTGLLADSDVVINPEGHDNGTYIKLDFWVHQDDNGDGTGSTTKQSQYINVSDLVDIYTAGDGISITPSNDSMDDTARGVEIAVVAATDTKFGGLKTGYAAPEGVTKSYAIKLDNNGNAYVAVPWETTSVTGSGDDYITLTVSDKTALTGSTDADPKYNYDIKVEAGAGLKKAEAYAQTSVQSVDAVKDGENANKYLVTTTTVVEEGTESNGNKNWGKAVTVDLTADAKDSLGLADSAVQTIVSAQNRETGVDDLVVSVSNEDVKGQKSYTVGLSTDTIASLGKADSAMQNITIMGTELDQESPEYTVANAKDALKLGTAAYVNVTDTVPAGTIEAAEASLKSDVLASDGETVLAAAVDNVATTRAVKTYVDDLVSNTDSTIREWVTETVITDLDSDLPVAAANPTDGPAYGNAYGEVGPAQQIITNINIVDGKIVKAGEGASTFTNITLKDIVDFAPIDDTEIEAICAGAVIPE